MKTVSFQGPGMDQELPHRWRDFLATEASRSDSPATSNNPFFGREYCAVETKSTMRSECYAAFKLTYFGQSCFMLDKGRG